MRIADKHATAAFKTPARVWNRSRLVVGGRDGRARGTRTRSCTISFPCSTFHLYRPRYPVATFPPNALRHIRVGDLAEIALDRHPGKILNARVATLVDISAQGQLAPSGDIPDWTDVEQTSRFAIRFELEEESSRFALPGGAGGAAAIYTDKAKAIRIVRKVVIRMYTWLNYFF